MAIGSNWWKVPERSARCTAAISTLPFLSLRIRPGLLPALAAALLLFAASVVAHRLGVPMFRVQRVLGWSFFGSLLLSSAFGTWRIRTVLKEVSIRSELALAPAGCELWLRRRLFTPLLRATMLCVVVGWAWVASLVSYHLSIVEALIFFATSTAALSFAILSSTFVRFKIACHADFPWGLRRYSHWWWLAVPVLSAASAFVDSRMGALFPPLFFAYATFTVLAALLVEGNFQRAVRSYAIVDRNDAIFLALLDPLARESYRVLQERERQEKLGRNGAAY